MNLNRRSFFKLLGIGAGAAVATKLNIKATPPPLPTIPLFHDDGSTSHHFLITQPNGKLEMMTYRTDYYPPRLQYALDSDFSNALNDHAGWAAEADQMVQFRQMANWNAPKYIMP